MFDWLRFSAILFASAFTIYSLLSINKKKKHFQIFPDDLKKQLYQKVRIMTFLNVLGVFSILGSCLLIQSPLFFVFIILAIFISTGSLYTLYDEFEDKQDE